MINELLRRGKENAIPAKTLIAALKLTPRDFYAVVESERRRGFPICASKKAPSGYYLAANQREAEEYAKIVYHTADEMRRTAFYIREGARNLPQ